MKTVGTEQAEPLMVHITGHVLSVWLYVLSDMRAPFACGILACPDIACCAPLLPPRDFWNSA